MSLAECQLLGDEHAPGQIRRLVPTICHVNNISDEAVGISAAIKTLLIVGRLLCFALLKPV